VTALHLLLEEDNIKMERQSVLVFTKFGWLTLVAGFCKQGNEYSVSIKEGNFSTRGGIFNF
jgi:hypothetical protein